MRQVTVTQLKNRLSEFLRLVKRGETVEVLERSVPIARIEAIGMGAPKAGKDHAALLHAALLKGLVREGVVTAARRPPDPASLPDPVPCATDPARVLVEERDER